MLDELHLIFSIFFREVKIEEATAHGGISKVQILDTGELKSVVSFEQRNFLINDVQIYDKFKPSKHSAIIIRHHCIRPCPDFNC